PYSPDATTDTMLPSSPLRLLASLPRRADAAKAPSPASLAPAICLSYPPRRCSPTVAPATGFPPAGNATLPDKTTACTTPARLRSRRSHGPEGRADARSPYPSQPGPREPSPTGTSSPPHPN